MDGETIHATGLVIRGAGVLIRGASGAGKSTLALLLLDRGAIFLGDDRIRLARDGDTLLARPHPALGSGIEVRGLGLCRAVASVPEAQVRLVVDLVARQPRLPEASGPAELLGLAVPRLVLDRRHLRSGLAPRLVLDALAAVTGDTAGAILRMPHGPGP